MLRHPRIRKIAWLDTLVKKLYTRDLWKPCVHTVAKGLSIGLFCSMLPIPFQMLIAASFCFMGRGNIPIAITACWISNPITQIPLMFFQENVGAWCRGHMDIAPLVGLDIEGTIPLVERTVNLANFTLGVALTAIFMGIIAYPIVYIIYTFIPKKHLDTKKEYLD